jgi:hypothetical protein
MDKIIRITLGLFIIILTAFTGILSYNGFVENAYRNTITGTVAFSCTITTDAPLYNVTFFIPVPTDRTGNSPMVSEFSNNTMKGVPAGWETTLFDTGKATMLKITTPAILPPEGTTASSPFTVTFSSETLARSPIETQDPVAGGIMFRPVRALIENNCLQGKAGNGSRCFAYAMSLYADYHTSRNTTVTIHSAIAGKNTWKIFEPRSNEYYSEIGIVFLGENHGWAEMEGKLSSGTGTYDVPAT